MVTLDAVWHGDNCPLVMWTLGWVLREIGYPYDAIYAWQELISTGVKNLVKEKCKFSKRWLRTLLADCKYQISLTFADQGRFDEAEKWKQRFMRDLEKGVRSKFDPGAL